MAVAKKNLIDPIYKKYTSRIVKTLESTEFYEYFMNTIETGKNDFQFSNRKIVKKVDETWVSAIEKCMDAFNNVTSKPRNFIREDEEIINVAVAKQATPDVVRHLAQHGDLIDSVKEEEVRPNRLMNKFKEDTWNLYENRFAYTLLERTYDFVAKRYEAIFATLNDEYGAYLKMNSLMENYTEQIKVNMDIRINQREGYLEDGGKGDSIFARIARIYKLLDMYMQTNFARIVSNYPRVKNPIVKTNAIRKNPDYKACYELWQFIYAYHDVGYEITVIEQSPEINHYFEKDIYHNIMFSYIVLKNYLENEYDREIDTKRKVRKRKMKPKYIREFIEEFVKNYDLPDVEVRKILIEEVTRAQLLREEEKERMRLIEEKQREIREKKKEEAREKARIAKEKQREKERIAREKEKERERKEREKVEERKRLAAEKQKREELIQKREMLYRDEYMKFIKEKDAMLLKIEKEKQKAESATVKKTRPAPKKRTKKAVEKAPEVKEAVIVEPPIEKAEPEEIPAVELLIEKAEPEIIPAVELPIEEAEPEEIPEKMPEKQGRKVFRFPFITLGKKNNEKK